AVDRRTLDRASTSITDLAHAVNDAARPTLCHRDLYADNLIVDDNGALVAILDWDMAEAWDPAAEWFKLDWLLFADFPNGRAIFSAAYHALHPEPVLWQHRKQLVDLMETLNTIANSADQAGTETAAETRARSHLQSLLDLGA